MPPTIHQNLIQIGKLYRILHYIYKFKNKGPTINNIKTEIIKHYLTQFHKLPGAMKKNRLKAHLFIIKLMNPHIKKKYPGINMPEVSKKIRGIWADEIKDEVKVRFKMCLNGINKVINERVEVLKEEV